MLSCCGTRLIASEHGERLWLDIKIMVDGSSYDEARLAVKSALQHKLGVADRASIILLGIQCEIGDGNTSAARDGIVILRDLEAKNKEEFPISIGERIDLVEAACLRQIGQALEASLLVQKVVQHASIEEIRCEAAIELARCLLALDLIVEARDALRHAKALAARCISDASDPRIVDLNRLMALVETRRKKDATPESERLFQRALTALKEGKPSTGVQLFTELLAVYPETVRKEAAGYYIGECHRALGDIGTAQKHWHQFFSESPSGSWRGQALQGLFDIALESQHDAALAERTLDLDPSLNAEWSGIDKTWPEAIPGLRLRKVLLLYILNQPEEAALYLDRIESLFPPPSTAVAATWTALPSPARTLSDRIRRREPLLAPEYLAGGSPKSNLLLMLGELYFTMQTYPKAISLLEKVANDKEVKATHVQQAHALFRLSDCHHWEGAHARVYAIQERFLRDFAKTAHAPAIMLRKGVLEYTQQKKPGVALKTFSELERLYPRAEEAESACVYRIVINRWLDDPIGCEKAIGELKKRYPNGSWQANVGPEFLRKLVPSENPLKDNP